MKKLGYNHFILFIICIISIGFSLKNINHFPQNIHCWAQADRYAISLGFINNGGNFFKPETFVYNKQFPNEFNTISDNTITSVDFPIHDYIVSLLMRLFHTTNPWVFQLYNLLYSIVGFYFLFKLTTLFTNSKSKQLFIVLFALSSPVLLYYQGGFLPSITSLANIFIAFYFFFKYQNTLQQKHFGLAVFFVTLSTLARLPFLIVLIALFCFELFYTLKNRKIKWLNFITLFSALLVIACYYLYNVYLRNTYGSSFLNYLIPATNFEEFKEILDTAWQKWKEHYFSFYHFMIACTLSITVIISLSLKKLKINLLEFKLLLLIGILIMGYLFYYLAMCFQFINHDYYFLDSFYIPIILIILFLTIKFPKLIQMKHQYLNSIVICILFIPIFYKAQHILDIRKTIFTPNPTAKTFVNADKLLNALNIPKEAKILTIGEDGPNNPFILMNRKGFAVMAFEKLKIENALTWPFDYVVIEKSKLTEHIYPIYPEIKTKLSCIGGNKHLLVFIRK